MRFIFSNKKNYALLYFLVVVFGFLCFFHIFYYGNNLFSTVKNEEVGAVGYKNNNHVEPVAKPDGLPQEDKLSDGRIAISSPENRTLAGSPSEAEVVRKWEESRGRFDEESLKDYAGYDLETLQSLANNGDVKAMIALARLYVSDQYSKEYGVKYSMPLLKKAAAYGSSYAIELYAIQYEADHFVGGSSDRSTLLESLSWSNVAALRGDLYPNNSATLDLRRKNIQLSQEDIQSIRKRSKEIYQQLQQERNIVGLGAFDDSVPLEVKKYFSYLENYMNDK